MDDKNKSGDTKKEGSEGKKGIEDTVDKTKKVAGNTANKVKKTFEEKVKNFDKDNLLKKMSLKNATLIAIIGQIIYLLWY